MKDFAIKIAEIMGILGVGGGNGGKTPAQIKQERADKLRNGNQNVLPGPPLGADGKPDYNAPVTDEEKKRAEEAGGYGGDPRKRIPKSIRDRLKAQIQQGKPTTVPSLGSDYQPPEMSGVTMYADGGITNGPSIAGEAGPEAVIPLKNGSIPLDINLGEMISALREQTDISRDLLDAMRDSKDIQQKILYATA
jgi:hypothetical protein